MGSHIPDLVFSLFAHLLREIVSGYPEECSTSALRFIVHILRIEWGGVELNQVELSRVKQK